MRSWLPKILLCLTACTSSKLSTPSSPPPSSGWFGKVISCQKKYYGLYWKEKGLKGFEGHIAISADAKNWKVLASMPPHSLHAIACFKDTVLALTSNEKREGVIYKLLSGEHFSPSGISVPIKFDYTSFSNESLLSDNTSLYLQQEGIYSTKDGKNWKKERFQRIFHTGSGVAGAYCVEDDNMVHLTLSNQSITRGLLIGEGGCNSTWQFISSISDAGEFYYVDAYSGAGEESPWFSFSYFLSKPDFVFYPRENNEMGKVTAFKGRLIQFAESGFSFSSNKGKTWQAGKLNNFSLKDVSNFGWGNFENLGALLFYNHEKELFYSSDGMEWSRSVVSEKGR